MFVSGGQLKNVYQICPNFLIKVLLIDMTNVGQLTITCHEGTVWRGGVIEA